MQPHRHRARLAHHFKRCRVGDIDGDFLDELWEKQEGRCCYCEIKMDLFQDAVLEHHRPLSRGGRNDKDNVSWACWDCNERKGTMTYEEFGEIK